MIIRDGRKNLPVLLDREVLQSRKLSYTAKGIYAYLCSLSDITHTHIADALWREGIESKREINDAIDELKDYGLLTVEVTT